MCKRIFLNSSGFSTLLKIGYVVVAALMIPVVARCESVADGNAELRGQMYFGGFVGNVFDVHKISGVLVEERFKYRLALNIQPQIGVYATRYSDFYINGGFARSWRFGQWSCALSSNVGLVRTNSTNMLGCPVEFLSYVELRRHFRGNRSVGFALGHISNAHLAQRNPGTEILRVTVSL